MSAAPATERPDELREILDEVRRIEVLSRRLVTEVMAGGYSSVFKGSGLEFDRVREYVPGDDPRKVDWNVTARVGRPFVKEFVDERELQVVFVLDRSPTMDTGLGCWTPRRMAARLAASLAFAAVRNDDRVGLVPCGDPVRGYAQPIKGPAHTLRIVRDCLVLPAHPDGGDLGSALEFVGRVLRGHAIVFVLSDFLPRPSGTPDWLRPLQMASRRHDVVAVRMTGPEVEPPRTGLIRVRDPLRGRTRLVDFGSAAVRDEYRRRTAAWRTRTEERLARAGVDLMEAAIPREPTMDAVARPVLRFFNMRRKRGAKR